MPTNDTIADDFERVHRWLAALPLTMPTAPHLRHTLAHVSAHDFTLQVLDERNEQPSNLNLSTFGDVFILEKLLGSGKHGKVWLASEREAQHPRERVVIKILHEYKRKVSSFYTEVELYQSLWELPDLCGFSRLRNTLTDKSSCHTGLVLDYVGIDLDELFSLCRRSWSIATVGRIWSMLIDRIEAVHVCGFVLRYVKGANLCIGGESGTTLFVIDLAGAKQYLDQDGKHLPCQNGVRPSGNKAFRSVNSDKGLTPSRRDDLESAAYAMIAFVDGGRLLWSSKHPDLSNKRCCSPQKLSCGYPQIQKYFGK
jgi:serine/threonine protein kinase